MKVILLSLLCCVFTTAALGEMYHPTFRRTSSRADGDEDKQYWFAKGQTELLEALQNSRNENVARNVILFVGDGMSITTVTSARIYQGQQLGQTGEEGLLSFERFPHIALSKTYSVDTQVSDSSATATAMLSGSKTNQAVVGVDSGVALGQCETMLNETLLENIMHWSQNAGKRTGVVTTTRITHATPASAYANSPSRYWECDADINILAGINCPDVKDIASQLVDNEPGRNFNVILGGGFQHLDGDAVDLPGDDLSSSCLREDGRKLWQEWLDEKTQIGIAAFVRNRTELLNVDLIATEYLMGLFANSHLPYEYEKEDSGGDFPTLSEMTESAITLLRQGPNGFFLLVEGGRIDHGHHGTRAGVALDETVELHNAVEVAMSLTSDQDTLIVVTADHSHTMSMGGYPTRGNPILGMPAAPASDLHRYTTLSYANGPGNNYTVVNDTVERHNPSDSDTVSFEYEQQAAVPLSSETHAGDDVAIYASGPMAHLFHGVHEQSYIAHVMAYASCVGNNTDHCSGR